MTPNTFTGRAEKTVAARNDLTTRIDEYDSHYSRLVSHRWSAAKDKRLSCPVAAGAGMKDSVDRGTAVSVSER